MCACVHVGSATPPPQPDVAWRTCCTCGGATVGREGQVCCTYMVDRWLAASCARTHTRGHVPGNLRLWRGWRETQWRRWPRMHQPQQRGRQRRPCRRHWLLLRRGTLCRPPPHAPPRRAPCAGWCRGGWRGGGAGGGRGGGGGGLHLPRAHSGTAGHPLRRTGGPTPTRAARGAQAWHPPHLQCMQRPWRRLSRPCGRCMHAVPQPPAATPGRALKPCHAAAPHHPTAAAPTCGGCQCTHACRCRCCHCVHPRCQCFQWWRQWLQLARGWHCPQQHCGAPHHATDAPTSAPAPHAAARATPRATWWMVDGGWWQTWTSHPQKHHTMSALRHGHTCGEVYQSSYPF